MVKSVLEEFPDQKRRFENFRNSLPPIYRYFDLEKHPRRRIAERLLTEWQSMEEVHDNSPFANVDRPGLILFGPPRSGKTQLACELAKRLLKGFNCTDARFYSAVEWAAEASARAKACDLKDWALSLVKFAWTGSSDEGVVILDDLDKVKITPTVQSELFALVEKITSNELRLIVTTNVSGDVLAKKFALEFGEAIVARLREFCVPVDLSKEEV